MNLKDTINEILLPIKLIIPQPIIRRIPGLTTNEDIRINKVLDFIRRDMNCLDIGCGNNRLIHMHIKRGGLGTGVDIYSWQGADLVLDDTSSLPFSDKSFDCITFVASLNHIVNRKMVLKESRRVLKDDGIVIITFLTPSISTLWHKISFWDRDQHQRGMKKGEIYGFSHGEISLLLEQTEFKVIRRERFSWGLNNIYVCKKAKSS